MRSKQLAWQRLRVCWGQRELWCSAPYVNDYLSGAEGNDNLTRGLGNDTLFAGASDYLKGDAGDDFFIFEANFGTSLIIDFETGTPAHHDFMLSKGGVFADAADVLAHAVQQATNVVITASPGDNRRLQTYSSRMLLQTISGLREPARRLSSRDFRVRQIAAGLPPFEGKEMKSPCS